MITETIGGLSQLFLDFLNEVKSEEARGRKRKR